MLQIFLFKNIWCSLNFGNGSLREHGLLLVGKEDEGIKKGKQKILNLNLVSLRF